WGRRGSLCGLASTETAWLASERTGRLSNATLHPDYEKVRLRRRMRRSVYSLFCLVTLLTCGALFAADLPSKIEFNRDIRPILSENCYQCHGPDKNKRKADLRLDTKEGVLDTVVVGKPSESEMIRRLTTPDKNERMPAPKSGKRLSDAQISVIKKWIEQGAEWRGHWAYIKPVRAESPTVMDAARVKNPIDRFILARLEKEQLKPSPEA